MEKAVGLLSFYLPVAPIRRNGASSKGIITHSIERLQKEINQANLTKHGAWHLHQKPRSGCTASSLLVVWGKWWGPQWHLKDVWDKWQNSSTDVLQISLLTKTTFQDEAEVAVSVWVSGKETKLIDQYRSSVSHSMATALLAEHSSMLRSLGLHLG